MACRNMCFWKLLEACKGLSCYWVPGTVSPSFDAKDLAALQEEEEQEGEEEEEEEDST